MRGQVALYAHTPFPPLAGLSSVSSPSELSDGTFSVTSAYSSAPDGSPPPAPLPASESIFWAENIYFLFSYHASQDVVSVTALANYFWSSFWAHSFIQEIFIKFFFLLLPLAK